MFDLDLTDVQASTGRGPLPAGEYPVLVEEAVLQETNDGTGSYIKTTFSVIDPAFQGRKVWHNFNIKNKSEKATQIGLSELKALIVAAGVTTMKVTSPEQLIGLECLIRVKISKEDGYEDRNTINAFKPFKEGAAPAASGAAATEVPKGADGKPIF